VNIPCSTESARQLFHEGCLALAELEHHGMRVDVGCLNETIRDVDQKIEEYTTKLKKGELWRLWKRRYGDKSSLGSRHQLATVLHQELGIETGGRAGLSKRESMDKFVLEKIDHPAMKKYLKLEQLKKLRGTYLMGLKREVVDGFVRPVFNLHLVSTFRSSADNPNIQNQIKRNEEHAKLLRKCFVPREGHVLVECDFSALEFRIAACFWKDKRMVEYASNPEKDVHRDMAMECYKLSKDQVTKKARFYAKNQFVFPILYGSYYVGCARSLWETISTAGLETADGVGLRKHLESLGIDKLGVLDPKLPPRPGTFVKHVQGVEKSFNRRFPEWSKKKDRWLELYRERGWFKTMTGFVCSGVYSRNEIYNYPVQGPAFHCLLWSLIQMVKWLRKKRMRSMIVAEIHDSLIADVHLDELDEFLVKVRQVMTQDIRKHWPWVVTPLDIEVEVGEKNWAEMKSVEVAC